jgi:DNA-binding protein HU-beta
VIELLKSSLEANKVVTVPQFGTFAVQDLKARKGRNPRTNQEIEIPASKTIRFKPSVGLKKAYNN